MPPQLQFGLDLDRRTRRRRGRATSTFDEALVPEDVVEVPVAVDDPPHRPAEDGQVVQELVGLAEIAPRVDDEQGLGAAHHADVEVVAVVPPSKATVADLVPH